MLTIIRSELRGSWPAWLGVALGFVMTSFALALSAMVFQSAFLAREVIVPAMEADAYLANGGTNFVLSLIVGLSVVASSTELVVQSRRGAVARMSLVGSTPSGVVTTVVSQLGVVALLSAVIGNLLAVAAVRPALDYLQYERGAESAGIPTPAVIDPRVLIGVGVIWVVVAIGAGLRQAWQASRIPPVEALRQAQGAQSNKIRLGWGRWLRAVLALLMLAIFWGLIPVLAANRDSETFTQIMQMNVLGLCVMGWFLAELAPRITRPVTAAWTRPRATVLAKADRLSRSVVPVMFSIGLAFGLIVLPASLNAIFRASGFNTQLEHVGVAPFLANLGLALMVAMSGSIGSLFMMSKQRDADLALLGIAGATPRQRIATGALEAVMITGTATILGALMAVETIAYLSYGATAVKLTFAFEFPLLGVLGTILITGLATAVPTVLPSLRSLQLPEPKVVARLIAE